ncbi:two-component sensor histidine kinase [Sphaerisporangium siamense]|uniref:histidine kinase n=1 Tax=Sphaerisporangium siamense TaxID=795645 RepID=A0A7W7GD09_9ACTN|nr:histidine kinase [Sphaerisporangium siamense]MBB4704049.1 signal transduction histidine kinase [Sphaerisporangium siamense]GII82524.1 two-component sensor histidine kinase [Sphaerisporangium siamense]
MSPLEPARRDGVPRQRWLLPGSVADAWEPEAATGRRVRRTTRDWLVDVAAFLLAIVFAVFTVATRVESSPAIPEELLALDQLTGALGCVALWLRRRWPVGLAVALTLAGTYSEFVAGATIVALFTVAVHRPLRVVAGVGVLAVATTFCYAALRPEPDMPASVVVAFGVTVAAAAVGWGMFVRAQRRLMLSLRERVDRAETEARLRAEQGRLRAEQAQREAREQIAREMHDVLGHRLSLLSVHAGALEFNPEAPREQVARAAAVIRESAHQALQELREVIGVLRAPTSAPTSVSDDAAISASTDVLTRALTDVPSGASTGAPASAPTGVHAGADAARPDRPQPTLAGLPRLVEESRQAGMRVTLLDEVGDPGAAPAALGRTAYRVAQEGLTNARKHAPGTEVVVRVSGGPGDGLTVELRNPLPARGGAATGIPGAGRGLIGLAERAALAGGRLACGPLASGEFRVLAWLPWPV